MKHKQAKVEDF